MVTAAGVGRVKLGPKQLESLATLGSPGVAMIVPGKVQLSLVRHGLLRTSKTGGFACITPKGLRALADALETGLVEGALEWARRERRKNMRRLASKEHA